MKAYGNGGLASLILKLEGSSLIQVLTALLPGKERKSSVLGIGGSVLRVERRENVFPLSRFEPRIFQLGASYCTDYVIPAS
jgi:hypothetical protein